MYNTIHSICSIIQNIWYSDHAPGAVIGTCHTLSMKESAVGGKELLIRRNTVGPSMITNVMLPFLLKEL